jgi:DNA-binding response OmpR family regulator
MRILIVESDLGVANYLKKSLKEEGFSTTVLHSGNEGLELALNVSFDLILLAWSLPGLSGLEICKEYRMSNVKTPIIFLTVKDNVEEVILALKTGANDYITKPFHFDELLARINVHFRKVLRKPILTLGSIKLNSTKHFVKKNDKEINLTQKEFALLEFLLENKNNVCSRTEIIEKVWDINFDYSSGIIDVFINAIRRKLELSDEENYIQTIRGIGYVAMEI